MSSYGIDLGTTYSAISRYNEDSRRVETVDLVTIADGNRMVRSVVFFPGPGQDPVVGEVAWNARRQSPERVAVGMKREMGSRDFSFGPIDGKSYSPQEVAAEILKALAKEVENFHGEQPRDVVITVPAYFEDNERSATLEAGRLAGLNVKALLSEPQAAALAYCIDQGIDIVDKYILVYDLGGGTFDVTLVYATTVADAGNTVNLDIRTLYKKGNVSLGGLDFDLKLAELVRDKVQAEHPDVDLLADPRTEAVLLDACEKAKRMLTQAQTATVVVADMTRPQPYQAQVTRADFENCTADLLMQTQALLEDALASAAQGLPDHTGQLHRATSDQILVLLSGGSSKMPMVSQMIEKVAGRAPLRHGNTELLVSMGAAYWAHVVQGGMVEKERSTPTGPKVISLAPAIAELISFSVGVEVIINGSSRNSVMIPRGANPGQEFEQRFAKTEDGMVEVPIVLYECQQTEGEDDPTNCQELGTAYIRNLPATSKAGEEVMVKLWFDKNLILRGEAVDEVTGTKEPIYIDRASVVRM